MPKALVTCARRTNTPTNPHRGPRPAAGRVPPDQSDRGYHRQGAGGSTKHTRHTASVELANAHQAGYFSLVRLLDNALFGDNRINQLNRRNL